MKTWNETREVLESAQSCLASGHACAIVVLTNIKGSAFRRPGAKLLIRADGSMTGNVSGGCLENDLRERAITCLAEGRQETVHYNTGSDEDVIWGLGLGCDGELDLLIAPVTEAGWIEAVLREMDDHAPLVLAWNTSNGPVCFPKWERAGPEPSPASGPGEAAPPPAFLDRLEPPPELVVAGAGDDAIPLVDLAAIAGFRVTVVDHRPGYLAPGRFPRAQAIRRLRPEDAEGILPTGPRTMAVIKNHALEMDKQWAQFFDTTAAPYIGILGPKKRTAQIRARLSPAHADRVYGPAGLDIGGEGAEQIAVALVAELLAVYSMRAPRHLRDREGAIHGG